MYKKVSTDLNFVDREKEVLKFWEDHKIFEKSMEEKDGTDIYMFYDGPPTANGKPHIGHVLTRVIKDMICREKRDGIRMDCRWNLRLKRHWGLTARIRLRSMGLSRLLTNVRKVSGSIRVCGRISPVQWVFGRIWIVHM